MDLSDVLVPGVLLIGGYLVISSLMNQASSLGAFVGKNLVQPAINTVNQGATSAQGFVEGYGVPRVVTDPSGNQSYNWNLGGGAGPGKYPGDIVLGISGPMTPGQFAAANPASPISKVIQAKPSVLSEWYSAVW